MNELKVIGSRRPPQTPEEYLRVAATLRRRFEMLTPLAPVPRGVVKFKDWESMAKYEEEQSQRQRRR